MMARPIIQATLAFLLLLVNIHISSDSGGVQAEKPKVEQMHARIDQPEPERTNARKIGRKITNGRKMKTNKRNPKKESNVNRKKLRKNIKKLEKDKNESIQKMKKTRDNKKLSRQREKKPKKGQHKSKQNKKKKRKGVKKSNHHKRKRNKISKLEGKQACDEEALCQKIKNYITIGNQLRKVRRIIKACSIMERKAIKSADEFVVTVTGLDAVLGLSSRKRIYLLKSRWRRSSPSTEEVTAIKDKLQNCSISAKAICQKSSVEACQNETLLTNCENELQGWLSKFGPSKGSCLQASDNCCACITALPDVSKDCLEFNQKSNLAVMGSKKCANGSVEGSFGFCKKLQIQASEKGPGAANCQTMGAAITIKPPCSKSEESVLTLEENGQKVNQKNKFDTSTGILTIEVPPHTTEDLNQNFTKSISMYHAATNTTMIKTNSSCMLSDIPDNINAAGIPEYFQQLKEGTEVWDNKNKITYFDIKVLTHIMGPEDRKTLILADMDNLCNNQIIKKTETSKINQVDYEKLVKGGIIFLNQEQNPRIGCQVKSACTGNGADSCSNSGWKNPETEKYISVHQVSSENLCLSCCLNEDPKCICEKQYPDVRACGDINNKNDFIRAYIWNGGVPLDLTFADFCPGDDKCRSAGTQTLTFNGTGEISIKIHVPSHGDIEETTVLMHAHKNGWWHSGVYAGDLTNNMMLKLGSTCHIQTLPTTIFPIDIAKKMKPISDGNFIIRPSDEIKKHYILLNDNFVTLEEEANLNSEIREICKNDKVIKYREIDISEDEFQKLKFGGIIDMNNERQTRECTLKTKVTSVESGCWRWPNPVDGTEIVVHGLVQSVVPVSCCKEPSGDHSTYCNCDEIVDKSSFERCSLRTDRIVAIAGDHGETLYDNFESFIRDENSQDLQLMNSPSNPSPFPVKTTAAVGAWIDNKLYVCPGYINTGDQYSCFLKEHGYGIWKETTTTILTDPLTYGGSSAKYKSGPKGDEPGETWWIIGGINDDPKITQEWNSVKGANPWDPPVLPLEMNTPCMVAISPRKIFVTAIPQHEEAQTNKAWIFSRDYEDNGGWKNIPSLLVERDFPACGFLPDDGFGRIVVAGGGEGKTSTEFLDINNCMDNNWNCTWESGPDLHKDYKSASMVTFEEKYLVLVGDQTDILAINSDFKKWEVVGQISPRRSGSVVLTI